MMTRLMLPNHRAPDQFSSHVAYVKQGSGTWRIRLWASDWPLPLLCREMRICLPLSPFLTPVLFFSPSVECATVARPAMVNTLFILTKSGMSATCSPLISIYCGKFHICTEIWCLSSCCAPERNNSCPRITCLKATFSDLQLFVMWSVTFLLFYLLYFNSRFLTEWYAATPESKCELVAFSFMNTEAAESKSDSDNGATAYSFEKNWDWQLLLQTLHVM